MDSTQQRTLCPAETRVLYAKLPGVLLPWYRENARTLPWRADKNPYHVWLSEIMLQQTRVDTVMEYYARFLRALPTVFDLARADEEKVLKLWEGLGYYSRARNLQKAAKIIAGEYNGQFPEDYKTLSALPGIGSYTAGAIASICFEQPTPAVDGNVLRIISRITENFCCIDQDNTKKEIGGYLAEIYPEGYCGDFTQSLMELGATVCVPNSAPLCGQCPMNAFCMAYQNGTTALLPVRKEKKPRKIRDITVFILRLRSGNERKVALRKRTEQGVLHGLWEFPNVDGQLAVPQVREQLRVWRQHHGRIANIVRGRHIFTHVQWEMTCYFIDCDCLLPFGDCLWMDELLLEREIALPTAFKKFWERHADEIQLLDFVL